MSEIELTMPSYVLKLIKNYDDKANALASGLAIRPLTAAEILAHLEDFGIDSTLAHGKVRQMSGGQRCRRAAIPSMQYLVRRMPTLANTLLASSRPWGSHERWNARPTLRTRLVLAAALSLTTYFYLRTYYLSY